MSDKQELHPVRNFMQEKYPFIDFKDSSPEEQINRFDVFLGAMRELAKDTEKGAKTDAG